MAASSFPAFVQRFIEHWGAAGVGKSGAPAMGIKYFEEGQFSFNDENIRSAFQTFMTERQFRRPDEMLSDWRGVLEEHGNQPEDDLFNKISGVSDNQASMTIDGLLNNDLEDHEPFRDAFTRDVQKVRMFTLGDGGAQFGVTLAALRKNDTAVLLYYVLD